MSELFENISEPSAGIIISLAELPKDAILDETAMAKAFGVTARTIKRMVHRYELPPPILLASKRSWKLGAVLAWIDESVARSEKDARRQAQRIRDYT
jgi:hypothetical protein